MKNGKLIYEFMIVTMIVTSNRLANGDTCFLSGLNLSGNWSEYQNLYTWGLMIKLADVRTTSYLSTYDYNDKK